jgi:hypothetical protein
MATNTEIMSWLQANPGATDTDIAKAMQQYGVTTDQMAQATGMDLNTVTSRFNTALGNTSAVTSPTSTPLASTIDQTTIDKTRQMLDRQLGGGVDSTGVFQPGSVFTNGVYDASNDTRNWSTLGLLTQKGYNVEDSAKILGMDSSAIQNYIQNFYQSTDPKGANYTSNNPLASSLSRLDSSNSVAGANGMAGMFGGDPSTYSRSPLGSTDYSKLGYVSQNAQNIYGSAVQNGWYNPQTDNKVPVWNAAGTGSPTMVSNPNPYAQLPDYASGTPQASPVQINQWKASHPGATDMDAIMAMRAGEMGTSPQPLSQTVAPQRAALPGTSVQDQIAQAWQTGDIAGLNTLLSQNNITSDQASQMFGLDPATMSTIAAQGVNFAGSTPTSPTNTSTTPTTYPNVNVQEYNGGSNVAPEDQQKITAAEGSPDWMKAILSPEWKSADHTMDGGVYTDPTTGFSYMAKTSGGGGEDGVAPKVDGYYEMYAPVPGKEGFAYARVLDINGNPTGEVQEIGNEDSWFVSLMPYVIAAAATFGVASTISGISGAATGAGTGATVAGNGAAMTVPTAAEAAAQAATLESQLAPYLSGATTLGGTGGLNPAFDTVGDITDAGIVNSPFAPPTTQAPLPMGEGEFLAATSNSGAAIPGPTPNFVPGTPFDPGLTLTPPTGGGTTPGGATTPGGTTTTPKVPIPGTGGGGTGGGGTGGLDFNGILNTLLGLGSGIYGANQQRDAANNMLDWMKGQQAKIDGLYAPGSPEYNLLKQQMEAKDAAAGRNSQYGVRAVDMAAKIAQIKAQYTAQLTQGLAGNFQSAFNQNASADSGLAAILGKLLQGGGGTGGTGLDLNKLLNSLFSGGGSGFNPLNLDTTQADTFQPEGGDLGQYF